MSTVSVLRKEIFDPFHHHCQDVSLPCCSYYTYLNCCASGILSCNLIIVCMEYEFLLISICTIVYNFHCACLSSFAYGFLISRPNPYHYRQKNYYEQFLIYFYFFLLPSESGYNIFQIFLLIIRYWITQFFTFLLITDNIKFY